MRNTSVTNYNADNYYKQNLRETINIKAMKTNQTSDLKQYARVARVFPKINRNSTNARIRVLATNNGQI